MISGKNLTKLIGLNIGVAAVSVACYSPGVLGLKFDASDPFRSAVSVTAGILLSGIFVFGNFLFLSPEKQRRSRMYDEEDLESPSAVMQALDARLENMQARNAKKADMDSVLKARSQLSKAGAKHQVLADVLKSFFEEGEMAMESFLSVSDGACRLILGNCRMILNRTAILLESDLDHEAEKGCRQSVQDALERNREILIKLDALLIEAGRIGDGGETDLEVSPAMQELEHWIRHAKYYAN